VAVKLNESFLAMPINELVHGDVNGLRRNKTVALTLNHTLKQ
jgi:hypothetical protein